MTSLTNSITEQKQGVKALLNDGAWGFYGVADGIKRFASIKPRICCDYISEDT